MNKVFQYNQRFSRAAELAKTTVEPHYIEPQKKSDVPETTKQLLDLIFSVDPVTHLPKGDLSMFLSPKTNAEVRLFIEQNLMNPQQEGQGLSLPTETVNQLRETITDDDIASFSRNYNETTEDYAERIAQSLNKMRFDVYRRKHKLAIEKAINGSGN